MSSSFDNDPDESFLASDYDEDHYDFSEHEQEDEDEYSVATDEKPEGSQQTVPENIDEMIQRDKKWLVKRAVINEKMIREGVREELFLDYDKQYVPSLADVDLRAMTTLVLSFRSIDAISNLNGFQSLRKLQLDNNLIEKIDNLDHLVNLEWLDLSFNFIKEIEGLDKLTKLKDLSLFNNRITHLTGLEKLTNLSVLSIGNNQITDVEQLRLLRKSKALRALNLKGNPISKEDDYSHAALAYLPQLHYLDYQLISSKRAKEAYDKRMEAVLEMVQEEQQEEQKLVQAQADEGHLAALREAGISPLHHLFDAVVKKDKELQRLQVLPGFMFIFDQYRHIFEALTGDLVSACIALHKVKVDEEAVFAAALDRQIDSSEEQLLRLRDEHQARVREAVAGRSLDVLAETRRSVLLVNDAMMEVETGTVHGVSTMLDEYSEVYVRLSKDFDARLASGFSLLADSMKTYERALQDHVAALLEKLNQGTDGNNSGNSNTGGLQSPSPAPGQSASARIPGAASGAGSEQGAVGTDKTGGRAPSGNSEAAADAEIAAAADAEHSIVAPAITVPVAQWPQELVALLNDKDHVTALIVASHDAHYACAVRVEEELRAAEEKRTEAHLKAMNIAEHRRNRVRVEDIYCICEGLIEEINQRGRSLAAPAQ